MLGCWFVESKTFTRCRLWWNERKGGILSAAWVYPLNSQWRGWCFLLLADVSLHGPVRLLAAKVVSIFRVSVSLFFCPCKKILNLMYYRLPALLLTLSLWLFKDLTSRIFLCNESVLWNRSVLTLVWEQTCSDELNRFRSEVRSCFSLCWSKFKYWNLKLGYACNIMYLLVFLFMRLG